MKKLQRIAVTKEGFDSLVKELENLKKERPQAVKNLSEARNMGDLSENGLYTAAKARLRSLDSQIFRIEMQIKLADVLEGTKDVVGVGSKVVVDDGSKEVEFTIVGDFEANPMERKISQKSPLGKALLSKKVGEIAIFEAPKGEISYRIVSIL